MREIHVFIVKEGKHTHTQMSPFWLYYLRILLNVHLMQLGIYRG